MQIYRTTVIIGFLGVLLGGWLLIQRVGGIIDSVAVPLPKCPLPGLSLPRGSVVEQETLEADGSYTALFHNNELSPPKLLDNMKQRFAALGLRVDAAGSNIADRRLSSIADSGLELTLHDPRMASEQNQYWELSI